MELALSLGDTPKSLDKRAIIKKVKNDLGLCIGLGPLAKDGSDHQIRLGDQETPKGSSDEPAVELDLLPRGPVPHNQPPSELRSPWLTHNLRSEPDLSMAQGRGAEKRKAGGASSVLSSPSSTVSSFQNQLEDFSVNRRRKSDSICTYNNECDTERRGGGSSASRGSGEEEVEESGLTRKKLRLSREQSAFLEDSFREHSTLNPRQKLDLAKQLNLRSRQVEVWFQNRRARTKLKQMEVDYEHLKRCYETLAEENRRLQKEVHELKVLNTFQPFYNQSLPPTTLTTCLSCERVASTAAAIDTARTRH